MATLRELPYIPLEVGENIIDQLGGHVDSLRSCALTCRGWNRHARQHLMVSIRIQSREDLYSICDYFASDPRMASLVRSLSMSPTGKENCRCLLEVLPVDLLQRLPNLQRYLIGRLTSHPNHDPVSFHATALMHIKTYLHVEELHLEELRFRTDAELARVLIALPRLQRLEYRSVNVDITTADTSRFRDKCNMLSEVTSHPWSDSDTGHIVPLIIQMSLSTLRILRCDLNALTDRVDLSELKHLHSVDLTTHTSIKHSFNQMISVIATVPSKKLRSLTISFSDIQIWSSSEYVRHPLDDAILTLDTSVVVSIAQQKHNRRAFWSKIVQGYLPRLHEAKLLQVQCSSGYPDGELHLGHATRVTAMASSPDGRYIATGALDGTVIVWNGTTAPERDLVEMQCPAASESVLSLHFSDNSELLAGIRGSKLLIWRVVDGVEVTSIRTTGHGCSCAWIRQSLDGLTLSVVDTYPAVTYTVHVLPSEKVTISNPVPLWPDHIPELHDEIFQGHSGLRITQSSSGFWVAAWNTTAPGCYVRRMADSTPAHGTYHLDFGHPHSSATCASFIGDTQLIVGFEDGSIRWWDISSSPITQTEPCGVLSLFPKSPSVVGQSMARLNSFFVAWASEDNAQGVSVLRRTKTRTAQGCLTDDVLLYVILDRHTKVAAACISPCERYIATASQDGAIRLWSTRDGKCLWTFRDGHSLTTHFVFSPDGRFLASGDKEGRVRIRLMAMFVRDVSVSSVDDTE